MSGFEPAIHRLVMSNWVTWMQTYRVRPLPTTHHLCSRLCWYRRTTIYDFCTTCRTELFNAKGEHGLAKPRLSRASNKHSRRFQGTTRHNNLTASSSAVQQPTPPPFRSILLSPPPLHLSPLLPPPPAPPCPLSPHLPPPPPPPPPTILALRRRLWRRRKLPLHRPGRRCHLPKQFPQHPRSGGVRRRVPLLLGLY